MKGSKEDRTLHDAFPGAERNQWMLRLKTSGLFYMAVAAYAVLIDYPTVAPIVPACAAYLTYTLTWMFISRRRLIPIRPSRALSIVLDQSIIAYGFWSGGAIAGLLIGVSSFATITYGISFGRRYQQFSLAVSCITIGAALLLSEYWRSLPLISLGIVSSMVLVPSYSMLLSERMARARDRAELRASKLERVNRVDSLTGLLNRPAFRRVFSSLLSRGKSGYLVFVDLDNFKQVNDRHGHAAGDEVLQEIARIFERCLRSYDIVARHAGDEFTILFTDTDDAAVRSISKRISEEIEQVVQQRYPDTQVSASMGICSYYGRSSQDVAALIQRADEHMYVAKQRGKGLINFCGELDAGPAESEHHSAFSS